MAFSVSSSPERMIKWNFILCFLDFTKRDSHHIGKTLAVISNNMSINSLRLVKHKERIESITCSNDDETAPIAKVRVSKRKEVRTGVAVLN